MPKAALPASTAALPSAPKAPDPPSEELTSAHRADRPHESRPVASQRQSRRQIRNARHDTGEDDDTGPDEWVPDPIVAREFNITLMSLWRWDRDKALGFPKAVKIRNRNFRSRWEIETFKERMLRRAIADRAHATPSSRR